MNPVEYAAGDDPLYGANPLRARGTFPDHWGDVPDHPSVLRCWIEVNALRDGASRGHPSTVQIVLKRRREDPSAVRERSAIAEKARLRSERLQQLLFDCP